ncbi:RNA polymerase sigma-70 factor (sigma-E family) [Kribbella amoyensis]|uniref:RNA polymerase sigma-70 factor (Sigma-E family) n=1 Tax=Kribbella amoyensis TaxID=996641 RepID=A0A561BPE6_9ACTN|nr:SigE family RNA polymerase sigma factor [Kribbella amoyensis]TWD80734.1 RNA polymerase sigma-70 factor (sigma-E family) [Kribbella amoyensis]
MQAEVSGDRGVWLARPTRRGSDLAAEFSEYVALRYDSLLRTSYLLTQDRGLAEDLLQTTLARCWLSWHKIEAENPHAYVRRALVNSHRAWWRLKRAKHEVPTETVQHAAADGGFGVLDDNAVLLQALARLPRKMCVVVVLRYLEDLTEAETAAAMGCSVGTVKSQTSRALAKLRLDPVLIHEEGQR